MISRKIEVMFISFLFLSAGLSFAQKVKTLHAEVLLQDREDDENYLFYKPNSMAIDDEGNIYISDEGELIVKKFNSEGKFLTSFGKAGVGPGELRYLIQIDYIKNRIAVSEGFEMENYDTNGEHISTQKIDLTKCFSWGLASESKFVCYNTDTKCDDYRLVLMDKNGDIIKELSSYSKEGWRIKGRFQFIHLKYHYDNISDGSVLFADLNKYILYKYDGKKISKFIKKNYSPLTPTKVEQKFWNKAKEEYPPTPDLPEFAQIINRVIVTPNGHIILLIYSKEFVGFEEFDTNGKYLMSYKLDYIENDKSLYLFINSARIKATNDAIYFFKYTLGMSPFVLYKAKFR